MGEYHDITLYQIITILHYDMGEYQDITRYQIITI